MRGGGEGGSVRPGSTPRGNQDLPSKMLSALTLLNRGLSPCVRHTTAQIRTASVGPAGALPGGRPGRPEPSTERPGGQAKLPPPLTQGALTWDGQLGRWAHGLH